MHFFGDVSENFLEMFNFAGYGQIGQKNGPFIFRNGNHLNEHADTVELV